MFTVILSWEEGKGDYRGEGTRERRKHRQRRDPPATVVTCGAATAARWEVLGAKFSQFLIRRIESKSILSHLSAALSGLGDVGYMATPENRLDGALDTLE